MPLQPGTIAPDITAHTETGESVRFADYHGSKNIVLFFYPQDDTSGCTREACGFRDAYEQLSAADTVIFGVSTDDAASHRAFVEKHDLNYPLLVDTDGAICDAFGVPRSASGHAARMTFLIDTEGVMRNTWEQVNVVDHAAEVERAIKRLT